MGWRRVMMVLSVFSEAGLACRIWGAVPGKGYSLMTWRNAADLAEMTALRPGAPGRRNAEAAPEDEALTGMARCRVRSPSPSWRTARPRCTQPVPRRDGWMSPAVRSFAAAV
jgi:hypothetical protein